MTGLVLWMLGLSATGLVYPQLTPVTDLTEKIQEQQQVMYDERERNYLAEQTNIIIEDYFLFLDKIGKIKYARGCMGEYSAARWNGEKRVKCSKNAYDCAGLIKGYGVAKGILTEKEAGHLNSQTIFKLGIKKDPRDARRGDFTSRRGYGERLTGNMSTHFAMVSRDYEGDGILWVYDNANGPNLNELGERPLKVSYANGMFYYLGKYKIQVATNGLLEKATTEGIEVMPRVNDEAEDKIDKFITPPTPNPIEHNNDNPLGFSVTIKGFAYDSDANRIASLWYDTNHDLDMIATFMHEAMFDKNVRGKAGERGMCQLMPYKSNLVWIKDERRSDPMRQAKICVEKWEAVPEYNRDVIRAAYPYRNKHKANIVLME